MRRVMVRRLCLQSNVEAFCTSRRTRPLYLASANPAADVLLDIFVISWIDL